MQHRTSVIFLMIFALLLAGCQVDTKPVDVENFSTNRSANKDAAAYNGTYCLYNDDSDKTAGPLLMTRHLLKDEIYGFEITDHVPYAIAGSDRLALQPGRYRWQMTPDGGQLDWNQTNSLTVQVIIAAAVVVLIVVSVVVAAH